MDPNQQPQNPTPQSLPEVQPYPQTPPVAPQPVPEAFSTQNTNPVSQPGAPVAPVAAPQPDPHFPANHPVPDGTKVVSDDPGKVLGIISFVGIFIGFGLISIILGIIGLKKSKRAGHKNGFAVAGIILGILEVIAALVITTFIILFAISAVNVCSELGSGTHVLTDGSQINCNI